MNRWTVARPRPVRCSETEKHRCVRSPTAGHKAPATHTSGPPSRAEMWPGVRSQGPRSNSTAAWEHRGLPTRPQAVCAPHIACSPQSTSTHMRGKVLSGALASLPKGNCPRLPIFPTFSLKLLTFPKHLTGLAPVVCVLLV